MQAKQTRPWFHTLWQVLWRCLVLLAGFGLLVALFYAVENWRGRRAWERYRAELKAQGERLGLDDYRSAPVPAELNFAETPLLRAIAYKGHTDPEVWGKFQAIQSVRHFAPMGETRLDKDDVAGVLEAFAGVRAELEELRVAARRPLARFTNSLSGLNPFFAETPDFVVIRNLAQLLSLHAEAELLSGHPEVAQGDIRAMQRLADSLGGQSTLVEAMIRVAIHGLALSVFERGLAERAWSDKSLADWQDYFASVDLLGGLDTAMRGGERNGVIHLMETSSRPEILHLFRPGGPETVRDHLLGMALRWCPRGWYDQSLVSYVRSTQKLLEGFDARTSRVDPEKAAEGVKHLLSQMERPSFYGNLAGVAIPNVSKALQVTAHTQTQLRLAAVMCALERHRRGQGDYPTGLGALVPQFIPKLPTDLLTGEPFKYERSGPGECRLYSVGWDRQDDHGLRGSSRESGDWVWPPNR